MTDPLTVAEGKRRGLKTSESVAIAGVSRLEGGGYYGARLFDNIVNGKAKACIYPVNPRLAGEDINGFKVYESIGSLPENARNGGDDHPDFHNPPAPRRMRHAWHAHRCYYQRARG